MDLTQLYYFSTVAKREHITQAANELHITQPALSKMIAKLEEDLGVKLFDRDGKRIYLNVHGKTVLSHAIKIFNELDEMKAELSDLAEGNTGKITLASSFPNREPNGVLLCIREYLMSHAGVQLSLRQCSTHRIPSALENREIDIAVSTAPIISQNVEWLELFQEKMGVILSVGHPLAQKEGLSLDDLREQWFLCNNANSDVQDLTYTFCRRAGYEPNILFEGDFSSFIGEAVSRGTGVSLISEGGFEWHERRKQREQWEKNIVFRPLTDAGCFRVCGLATLKGRYFPKATSDFYNHLIQNFDETLLR